MIDKAHTKAALVLGMAFFGFGSCNPEPDKLPLAQTCVTKWTEVIAYDLDFNQTDIDTDNGCENYGSAITDGTLNPGLMVDMTNPFTYFTRADTTDSANNPQAPSSQQLMALVYPNANYAYTIFAQSKTAFIVPANLPEDVLDADKVVNFRINHTAPEFPDAVGFHRTTFVRLLDDNDQTIVSNLLQTLIDNGTPNAGTLQLTLKVGHQYKVETYTYAEFFSLGPATPEGTEPTLIESVTVHPWVTAAPAAP